MVAREHPDRRLRARTLRRSPEPVTKIARKSARVSEGQREASVEARCRARSAFRASRWRGSFGPTLKW